MLSSWCSFEECNLCTNGHVQSLGVNATKDLDGSIFLCVCSWSYTNSERKKFKKAINYTGSGLFWTQLGLCILHSVGAKVKLIKDADI